MFCVTLGKTFAYSDPWSCVSFRRVIGRAHGLWVHVKHFSWLGHAGVSRQTLRHQNTGSQIINQNVLDGDKGYEAHLEWLGVLRVAILKRRHASKLHQNNENKSAKGTFELLFSKQKGQQVQRS